MGIKKQNNRQFAKTVKRIAIGRSLFWLIVSFALLVTCIIASSYLIDLGMPLFIMIAAIALFMFLTIIFSIQLKRIHLISLEPERSAKEVVVGKTETIMISIPSIMRYDQGAGSYSILGTGKSFSPENAFLLTNENIWAVTVPVEGAGKVIAGTEINKWNWMTDAKEIREQLKQMTEAMTLRQIILSCESHRRIANQDIIWWQAKDSSQGIHFKTIQGITYAYSIRDFSDYEKLKNYFHKNICIQ